MVFFLKCDNEQGTTHELNMTSLVAVLLTSRGLAQVSDIVVDHIAHHILTIYALGASPTQIQKQYDNNKSYQRAPQPVDDGVLEDLRDPVKFRKYLANERYYHDYLLFFQGELDKKGYEEVINEYILKGDERADDMLVRMYAGTSVLRLL